MAPHFNDDRNWLFEKRFGLFIHWGIYAIPAFHEQVQNVQGYARKDYEAFATQFNPERFAPDAWLDFAQSVGMEYLTFTTKHHDGFCMWASDETDYTIMNTPYGKDIVAMLADACHRRDFPLCLYHSVVDWHHPNYPNEGRHHELPGPEAGDQPDWDRYVEYLRRQVTELCTRYGKIHGWWWDMNVPQVRDPSINAMIRELQPGIIINDRGMDEGDYGTPEREYDTTTGEKLVFDRPTEACQSVDTKSWGYKTDADFYSDAFIIRAMDGYLAKDANYLLNVGPKADGTIPDESASMLDRIGDWYGRVKEAFTSVEPASDLTVNRQVLITKGDSTLYVHLHRIPNEQSVSLEPLNALPKSATLLNDGRPVDTTVDLLGRDWAKGTRFLRLRNLPVNDFANEALVVKLEM